METAERSAPPGGEREGLPLLEERAGGEVSHDASSSFLAAFAARAAFLRR
jgi:hypothetical protein